MTKLKQMLSIIKFILHYLTAITGKILAYILTPIIFGFRHSIRNYTYNFIRQNNLKLKRDINCEINYQKTNKILGYFILILWFFLDDDANLDISSRSFTDEDKLKGLKIKGKYFTLGKHQTQNPNWVHFYSWYNFKAFYGWTIMRNGFYNWNYLVEDSYLDDCDIIDLPTHPRIHESNPNITDWNIKEFFQDRSGKWFFYISKCTVDKDGFASGYEIGFRRIQAIDANSCKAVNAVVRRHKNKKWVNGKEIKK